MDTTIPIPPSPRDFEITRPLAIPKPNSKRTIPAPNRDSFTAHFGHAFPVPHMLTSDLGTTAVYSLPPPASSRGGGGGGAGGHSSSSSPSATTRRVLLIHGLNTPALGMLSLARAIQNLDAAGDTHVVLFDLWGHGLSSTPLLAHTPHVFHLQILQVLSFMKWPSAELVGYSFGACVVVSFAQHHPWTVRSAVLLAPAGLLDQTTFSRRMRELLNNDSSSTTGREEEEQEAAECVLEFLEGGTLQVPVDWKERSRRGEVVAEALKDWELREHQGYRQSVLSMFRDGAAYGCEKLFENFAQCPSFQKLAVVAELDPVCNKEKLAGLGIENVEVVEKQGHAFVRTASDQVASIIHRFWLRLEQQEVRAGELRTT